MRQAAFHRQRVRGRDDPEKKSGRGIKKCVMSHEIAFDPILNLGSIGGCLDCDSFD